MLPYFYSLASAVSEEALTHYLRGEFMCFPAWDALKKLADEENQ